MKGKLSVPTSITQSGYLAPHHALITTHYGPDPSRVVELFFTDQIVLGPQKTIPGPLEGANLGLQLNPHTLLWRKRVLTPLLLRYYSIRERRRICPLEPHVEEAK
jgi:hypothetical protein